MNFPVQINTVELDLDNLCNWHGDWTTIDRVMEDWRKTESPLNYWFEEINPANHEQRFRHLALDATTFMEGRSNLSYGLPSGEAIRVCRRRYAYDVAKLTIQIAEPNVVVIRKDVSITLGQQVAFIGKSLMHMIRCT